MKALRIRDWDKHYENNRSRELRRPEWLPLPNSFDGAGYMELCDDPAGTSHYGAWCMLLAAASRMPTRGLMVGNSGRPYSLKDIARMTRGQLAVFEAAIPRLIAVGWVEEIEVASPAGQTPSGEWRPVAPGPEGAGSPQHDAGSPQDGATPVRLKGNRNGKGKENGTAPSPPPSPGSATTATRKPAKVVGIDTAAARRALEAADLVGLIRAYGGNLAGERAAEWARDCHGKTLHTVAVVLGWQYRLRSPLREPSGFRRAWDQWAQALTEDDRRTLSIKEMDRIGLQVEIRPAAVPPSTVPA